MKTLKEHKKRHDYLVCVDSDGCAMDTMDVKHFRAFGPCMVDEWELGEWRREILERWNVINLYSITRGINRFLGLAKALSEINSKYKSIEGFEALARWTEESPELSNGALRLAIEANPNEPIFAKALSWSIAVNRAIEELPNEVKQPFPMVKEALEFAGGIADVAIVSSANLDAVLLEWEEHGLLDCVDVVMSQNDGSKAYCISALLALGYERDKTVMCGDAPGDLGAAEKNGVHFYPILVKRERESWEEFISTAMRRLTDGEYGGAYGDGKKKEFYTNLGE